MLEFTSAGRPVHLSPGTSVQLTLNSPLFDEDTIKGSFSYSFGVPASPNGPLYGYPERPDGQAEPSRQLPAELAEAGVPLLTGTQRVKSATPQKYSVNMQAGLSGANLSERQLSSFSYGGLRACPRWVQQGVRIDGSPKYIPGIVQHANQVVATPGAYDYVFAPFRNEYVPEGEAPPLDALGYPPRTVNQWGADTFIYAEPFLVNGQPEAVAGLILNLYCPQPRLRYVLQAIMEESGLAVDMANLLPGELGELVLASSAQLVDRGDGDTYRFSLADVLPALTVAELLAALRQDLGVVVYVEADTQLVRTGYLRERVAPGAAYTDLTRCLAGDPEVTVEDSPGLTLTYAVDGDDVLTSGLLDEQPLPELLLDPVATVADLPATTALRVENPRTGQVRLVQALDTYYACTVGISTDGITAPLTWAALVLALPPVPVAGGGEEQAQRISYTAELPTRLSTDGMMPLPAISQPPYRADQTQVARSAALRLFFYRGIQLASDGVTTCPQLSHRSPSGALSVRLSGPAGAYAQLLATWLPVKLRGSSYKQPLLLTPLDLARLDLSRPVWLDGVAYLVRKLTATVPLKKVASAELVRL